MQLSKESLPPCPSFHRAAPTSSSVSKVQTRGHQDWPVIQSKVPTLAVGLSVKSLLIRTGENSTGTFMKSKKVKRLLLGPCVSSLLSPGSRPLSSLPVPDVFSLGPWRTTVEVPRGATAGRGDVRPRVRTPSCPWDLHPEAYPRGFGVEQKGFQRNGPRR